MSSIFLHIIKDIVLALFCWGVPGMQFDLPQFDLLVPRATTVLPELIWSLWMKTWLTHVSGNKNSKCKNNGNRGIKLLLFVEQRRYYSKQKQISVTADKNIYHLLQNFAQTLQLISTMMFYFALVN